MAQTKVRRREYMRFRRHPEMFPNGWSYLHKPPNPPKTLEEKRIRDVERSTKYHKTLKGKVQHAKQRAKRRGLLSISLNKPFVGSVAHHIDKIYVINIPKKLHESIPHNVWTNKGMREINTKVFEWMPHKKLETKE